MIPSEASIPVTLEKWIQGVNDAHGNPVESYGAPTTFKIYAYNVLDWRSAAPDVISADYDARLVYNLELHVVDASMFSKNDRVSLDLDEQDEIVSFLVQNIPHQWNVGAPFNFSSMLKMVPGTVHVRRVT